MIVVPHFHPGIPIEREDGAAVTHGNYCLAGWVAPDIVKVPGRAAFLLFPGITVEMDSNTCVPYSKDILRRYTPYAIEILDGSAFLLFPDLSIGREDGALLTHAEYAEVHPAVGYRGTHPYIVQHSNRRYFTRIHLFPSLGE